MKELILALTFGVLASMAAYYQRGCWAVGIEVILPILLLAGLLKREGKQS